MQPRLRVLVTTRLFPNAAHPSAASFNRQQFAALGRLCDLDVLAVIPWFPGARLFARWSAAGQQIDVPRSDTIAGLAVRHPRVFYLPAVGHELAPAFYAASLLPYVWRLRGRVDVVLGSWAYPDGVAALALGRFLGAPVVVKVHGSDINVIAEQRKRLRKILSAALPRAAAVVAVSRPLAQKVELLGVPAERIAIVPNGVDRSLFRLEDRTAARAALGVEPAGRLILYVGRFEKEKGTFELLDAYERIAAADPEIRLALVGGGKELQRCNELAARFPGRVVVLGPRPLEEVARWMAACDIFTLPSWNEGQPNVILEAFACGRRVVATNVGGIPDVVSSPALGELVAARDAPALAQALARAAYTPYDPAVMTAAAPGGWPESAARLHDVLAEAVTQQTRV